MHLLDGEKLRANFIKKKSSQKQSCICLNYGILSKHWDLRAKTQYRLYPICYVSKMESYCMSVNGMNN